MYVGCSTCKVKIHSPDGILGECGKCGMMFKVTKCPNFFTANISVTDKNQQTYDIKLFHDNIIKVIGCEPTDVASVQVQMLSAPPLRIYVDKNNIAFSVVVM